MRPLQINKKFIQFILCSYPLVIFYKFCYNFNMNNLIIKNINTIDPKNEINMQDIYVRNGFITSSAPPDALIIDGTGLYAAPGLVDIHVHLRDPGQTHKEDIESGCSAAAAGGITSVIAMPNTKPAVDSVGTLEYIYKKAKNAKVHVYSAAAITKNLDGKILTDMAALKHTGAAAFSDDGMPVADYNIMKKVLQTASDLGMPVLSHCEDMTETDTRMAEYKAVQRDIEICREIGVPLHICHVSTAESLEIIRAAKAEGLKITCETAPHYFSLTRDMVKGNANYKMNPPLREKADTKAVIRAIKDGTIDVIATDHAPHAAHEKTDFDTAMNGITGLETSFALGITYLVKPGHITINKLIELMSVSPAEIMNINAGSLIIGSPADIAIFDINKKWTVKKFKSKSANNPFLGMELTGKVLYTIVNGKVVYEWTN